MPLELDIRQRAMLQEMGVHVWLPESGVAVLTQAPALQSTGPLARVPGAAAAPLRAPAGPQAVSAPAPDTARPAAAGSQTAERAAAPPAVPVRAVAAASPDWAALQDAVRNCQACGLCAGRSHTTLLPPADPTPCDWMLVGDVPDEDEDRAGAPFAGQDGLLLGNMLRALGLQRANPLPAVGGVEAQQSADATRRAYVSNVLKCRPAHGAIPQAAELAHCTAHLQREIALVQPKMILAMGRFANQVLLAGSPALAAMPLGKLRGSVHSYQGIPVVVTYPPKLLMRNSADKAKAWADLCLAATQLEN